MDAGVVDLNYAWMLELCGSSCLVLKSSGTDLVMGEPGRQHLDRDDTIQRYLTRLPDGRHAAFPYLLYNFKPGYFHGLFRKDNRLHYRRKTPSGKAYAPHPMLSIHETRTGTVFRRQVRPKPLDFCKCNGPSSHKELCPDDGDRPDIGVRPSLRPCHRMLNHCPGCR